VLREPILGISETQAASVIRPDGVTDDLWWKSVSIAAVVQGVHRRSVPRMPST
jgi:hypothetical protein